MLSTLRLSSCDVEPAIGFPGCIPGFENGVGYFCLRLAQAASVSLAGSIVARTVGHNFGCQHADRISVLSDLQR